MLQEIRNIRWVTVARNLGDKKLAWYAVQLESAGIATRHREGLRGTVLQVPFERAGDALEIMDGIIGETSIGLQENYIRWGDLNDNSSIFDNQRTWVETNEPVPQFIDPNDLTFPRGKDRDVAMEHWIDYLTHHQSDGIKEMVMSLKPYWTDIAQQDFITVIVPNSSTIGWLGFRKLLKGTRSLDDAWELLVIFKSGGTYKYRFVIRETILSLLVETCNVIAGIPSASVGKLFAELIRRPADKGELICEKQDGDKWVKVEAKKK